MPVRHAPIPSIRLISRFAQCFGLAACFLFLGSESLQNAIANGDTRTISLHNVHTGEDLTVTYKRGGRYDEEGLGKLNHILRDWRRNEEIKMDPQLIDLVWEAHRELGAKEAVHIICGYRAPATNAMLRRRSSGVARASQHTVGKAMDFYIPGADLAELRAIGLRLQRGGVGFYPSSGSPFVHLDIGSVRHWPRMTRDQLARVFPDGRTVHIPSDGNPMSGYAVALADIEKNGGKASTVALQSTGEEKKSNFLAKLFGFGKGKDEDDDGDVTASVAQAPARAGSKVVQTQSVKSAAPTQVAAATPNVPMPKARPQTVSTPVQVASATPVVAPKAGVGYALASASPQSVFETRGYWRGMPETTATANSDDAQQTPPMSDRNDRVPVELALAYAADARTGSDLTQNLLGLPAIRPANVPPPATSIAHKSIDEKPSLVQSSRAPAVGDRIDEPWLRAMMLAPSIEGSLTTTQIGARDYRTLTPLLQRPSSTLVMGFSEDPYFGMTSQSFSGEAVFFLATATFSRQTAGLQ